MKINQQLLAAGLLIFISRLPFLFDGYGSEEDAWALRLVAENISKTGVYEVSRLPGHPLQELVYAGTWRGGALLFNMLTALLSTLGILYFIKTLRALNVKNAVLAGLTLAAIPVVYINSTNAMDYTWAMAFVLISFYQLTNDKPVAAGVFLALATGCRITSAVFGIPFLLYIFWFNRNSFTGTAVKLIASSVVCTLLIFVPVFINYGYGFFTYYEHFPIPGFAKNFYKGVIAVWGLPMLVIAPLMVVGQLRDGLVLEDRSKKLLMFCLSIVLLVTIMFMRVPLKSAFMIPLVPFVVMIAALILSTRRMQIFAVAAVISCFLLGVNLDDSRRGSSKSELAYTFSVSDQPVVVDLLQGLVSADQSKRIQRTAFAHEVIEMAKSFRNKTVVIAGWWLADILVLEKEQQLPVPVQWRYYTEEDSLKYYSNLGNDIYYLPEQDKLNDLRFKQVFTANYASPYPLIP